MINVFMVDNRKSTIKEVKQYFENNKEVCIKSSCLDGNEALKELISNGNHYDVLLLNPILSKVDGIELLKLIERNHLNIKTIIYTDYYNSNLIRALYPYNITFFLLNNINKDIIKERIIDSTKLFQQDFIEDNTLDKKISKLLHDLGMPSHIKGYQYIRDAIIMMHNDSSYFSRITKQLYPELANRYETTSSRVERAIRHAIEVCWNRGDYDLMDEIFGHSVDFDRAKPTNSEFLATVADKINLEEKNNKVKSYI